MPVGCEIGVPEGQAATRLPFVHEFKLPASKEVAIAGRCGGRAAAFVRRKPRRQFREPDDFRSRVRVEAPARRCHLRDRAEEIGKARQQLRRMIDFLHGANIVGIRAGRLPRQRADFRLHMVDRMSDGGEFATHSAEHIGERLFAGLKQRLLAQRFGHDVS